MPRPSLRDIPSVDQLLRDFAMIDLPRPALREIIRKELTAIRKELAKKQAQPIDIPARIRTAIDDLLAARIRPVINGTGVIIHTNLGRSPLGEAIVSDLARVAWNYSNLEFDITGGTRGGRAAYLEHNLAILCGAEAATVVNNCAAALVLILRHFAAVDPRREVIISRGELVQIGGGFRIPEVLEASGAVLREIGTTNKTTLADYSRAIRASSAMILKVHRSNFFMRGFVESPETSEIAKIASKAKIPFVEDLGSGAVFDTKSINAEIAREPTPADVLKHGADLVTFSGDKLLGGPQAGIIAGDKCHIDAIKRHPFFRAVRCDKLRLFALERTVDLHLGGDAHHIPAIAMMRTTVDALHERGSRILEQLADVRIDAALGRCESQIGGGSLPGASIDSIALELSSTTISLATLAERLRRGAPAVIGSMAAKKLRLDLRTIFADQDSRLVECVREAVAVNP